MPSLRDAAVDSIADINTSSMHCTKELLLDVIAEGETSIILLSSLIRVPHAWDAMLLIANGCLIYRKDSYLFWQCLILYLLVFLDALEAFPLPGLLLQ